MNFWALVKLLQQLGAIAYVLSDLVRMVGSVQRKLNSGDLDGALKRMVPDKTDAERAEISKKVYGRSKKMTERKPYYRKK